MNEFEHVSLTINKHIKKSLFQKISSFMAAFRKIIGEKIPNFRGCIRNVFGYSAKSLFYPYVKGVSSFAGKIETGSAFPYHEDFFEVS